MSFRSLADGLRDTANHVITFLRVERGLKKVRVEEELVKGLPRPTLHVNTSEGEVICVEFSETDCYPPSLARFAEDFRAEELPVKIFIALPSTGQNKTSIAELARAKKQGIGVMLVGPAGKVTVLDEPISQLLTQLRRITMSDYPAKLRARLSQAESTFLSGNPPKGCSELYDLLEEITRRIVAAAISRGLWNGSPPNFDPKIESWYNVCSTAYTKMQFKNIGKLSPQIWASVLAITRHRNETGHSPTTLEKRRRRDLEMRTRFEHAADLLRDLIDNTRKFRY
jgi:hypothetical protein